MSNLQRNIKVIEALKLVNEDLTVELNYNSITISVPKNKIINLLKKILIVLINYVISMKIRMKYF